MNEPKGRPDPLLQRFQRGSAVALLLASLAAQVAAQPSVQPVIYPVRGQSAQQQDQDRYECHTWARGQSGGYDPTQPAPYALAPSTTPSANPSASTGATVTGMAAGAMGGAAIAELTHHDAGRGAAAGALGGAVVQRVRLGQASQQQQAKQATAQQQTAQQQAARQQQRSTYERAWSACLEGRGYTVK